MARAGPGRAGGARRGQEQLRPPTWEISDSDAEGPASAETPATTRDPAGERRPAAEALRWLRPWQAVRRLAVLVDPAVLEDAGADTLMEALHALGCEPRVEPQRPARSLRWSRASPDPCPRGVPPEVWAEDEPHVLLLLEPEEFVRGVIQLTQDFACFLQAGTGRWAPPATAPRNRSQQPRAQETQQPGRPAVTRTKGAVSWPEVEEALVHLQLWENVDVLLVASWQELSQHMCAFTKALAQRPFKRWVAGERVARDGAGLRGAWWRQVRQFNRVSPAVADTVVSAFPSPRLLQQVYMACGTKQERLALLADLPVKTGKGVPPRRVGPDLSRRICLFLTTTDPDLLLDLGS
ncbi:probable crossover junction endonuclease EME2 isoform X2 [Muntiacus reevesi]|uniref:probable crossover junction endonuclease EME2 isoform X2 n=1 Tax=Muntiacus reevesi TaxID=9886 RepID=UPI003306FB14